MQSVTKGAVAVLLIVVLAPACGAVEKHHHHNHASKLRKDQSVENKTLNTTGHQGNKAFLGSAEAATGNATEDADTSDDNATAQESDASGQKDSAEDSTDDKEEVVNTKKSKTSSKMQTTGESRKEKMISRAKMVALDKLEKAKANVEIWEAKVNRSALRQAIVAEQKEYMEDERGFKSNMAKRVTLVANETQTKALSEFLGGMWTEMRKFSAPFFKQHLEDEAKEVSKELKKNKAKLADAKDEEAAAKGELQKLIKKEKEMKGMSIEDIDDEGEDEKDEDDEENDAEDDEENKKEEDDDEDKAGEERKKTEAKDKTRSAASRTVATVAGLAGFVAAFFV